MSVTRGRLLGLLVAVGIAATLLVATPAPASVADPLPAPDPSSQLIGCDQAAVRVQVSVTSHLDPSCTYTAGFDVVASDVVLDCQGALVRAEGTAGSRGIEVSTPADVSMSGVTVRNCRVEGFLNSVRITRVGFRSLPAGGEFEHTLSDVVVEDSVLVGSRGVGVFVDGYVSRVTLRRLEIRGAGSTGVYLEAGSKENVVVDNLVHQGGFRENGPEGQLITLGGTTFRYWGTGREGIAIDGSFDNVVARNTIVDNSAGGIFVYTNCGEFVTQRPERWYERRYGAERNVIEDNHIARGLHGVWVGSRMGENTYPMECSQEAYVESPLVRVVLDRAADNTVRGNTFDDVTYGVRVEDDRTRVIDNTFIAPDDSHHAVVVGTRVRTSARGRPVTGTVVTGNESLIVGNRHPYRWVHGETATTFAGNRALGQEVGLCEGRQLPYNAFIFVLAVALEPTPGPAPTPDLTVPELGPLPPCDPPTPPVVVPGSAQIGEGDAGQVTVDVPVTLSAPTPNTVTVEWTLVPAGPAATRATGGVDHLADSGTVTLPPGTTRATVPVTVLGDVEAEPDELFAISFRSPTNAVLGGFWGLGLVAIHDDEALPVVVPGAASAAEPVDGSVRVEVGVSLSRPSSVPVTVEWTTLPPPGWLSPAAVPGADHLEASGTVTFAPGQTSATASIDVLADDVDEPSETVLVSFRAPSGARLGGFFGLATLTITEPHA